MENCNEKDVERSTGGNKNKKNSVTFEQVTKDKLEDN